MSSRVMAGILGASLLLSPAPAAAGPFLIPPVDGPVSVRFVEPLHRWAPGHRGIDYSVAPGAQVRAAAAGVVSFAGDVAGHLAVTIDHDPWYQTTYTSLGEIAVTRGQAVSQGQTIGVSAHAHPNGAAGLHFGVRMNGAYVDPVGLLGTLDVSDAIRLAPLVWQPPHDMPDAFRSGFAHAGTAQAPCRPPSRLEAPPHLAPNENVALAIAGIGSSTDKGVSADMYEHGPEELGYDRVYRFSYAGPDRDDLHRPYSSLDTFADISRSADDLRATLLRIAESHPGRDVDLIAHSMGGLVARRFLAEHAGEPGMPRVEHLVTFATPHGGSSLAHLPQTLGSETLTGGLLLDSASWWARRGGPVPDPRSIAVRQLAPRSGFLTGLAREGVAYGTRTLALGIANDVVVTADRARWQDARSRTVSPSGLIGHSAIVSSDAAQGIASAFLRDAAPSCETAWDLWGPRLGRAMGWAQEQSYRAVAGVEAAAVGRVLRVGRAVDRYTSGRLGRLAQGLAGKAIHRIALWTRSRAR